MLVLMLAGTVGVQNLASAFALYFHGTNLVSNGHSNTAWAADPYWTVAYYLTPYIIILLLALSLYAPPRGGRSEHELAQVAGMAAAAAAFAPFDDVPCGLAALSRNQHRPGSALGIGARLPSRLLHAADRVA